MINDGCAAVWRGASAAAVGVQGCAQRTDCATMWLAANVHSTALGFHESGASELAGMVADCGLGEAHAPLAQWRAAQPHLSPDINR